ncbi:MAG TPA: SpoIIE family protein phosphatase [Ignavibacteriaceae bacterium]|nr:SpoIIE family protein phosphatase [Ignavibacteriaceae bacterium]
MKKHVSLITFFLLLTVVSLAQKPSYNFKNIHISDGLVNSTIMTLFQDSYGFIWIATQNGVQRYDGKSFRSFTHSESDTTGLSSNFVLKFCEDSDGNIWLVTIAGLNKYDRKTDKIIKYNFRDTSLTKNNGPVITNIIRDNSQKNMFWLFEYHAGIIKLNISNDSTTVYPFEGKRPNPFIKLVPYAGNENKLLVGADGLYSFDKISGKYNKILKLEQNSTPPNNGVNGIVFDPANRDIVWLATGDFFGRGNLGGLIRYDLKTGWEKTFTPENRSDLPGRNLMSVCFDGNDKLWVGTRNNGVLLYDKKEDKFYDYKNNEYDRESFVTDNAVLSMLKDNSGTMWFGTWGDGISLLSPTLQKFSQYKHLPGRKNGLIDNNINTFAEDIDGNIWIGTNAGNLSKFNPHTRIFSNYFPEFIKSGGKSTQITYLYYDSRKNLWIGTYDDALYRFNPVTGTKIHYVKGPSKNEVTQKRITAITEFKKGEILISTYGGGLNIYNYSTNSFEHFTNNPKDSTSIPDNQIWLPFIGNDGNYYFSGNNNNSFYGFNPETKKFFKTNITDKLNTFTMPCKTSDGTVYINSIAAGLQEIKFGKELSLKTLYDINGNPIKNIQSIVADSYNNLWMGTDNGIIKFNPKTKVIVRYSTEDGLQGNVFNRMAAFKSTTGEMYIGGRNGFCVFHPEEIKNSSFVPPVVFTDFKLFQKSVGIGKSSVLKENIQLSKKIVLSHDQNDFSVSFAALDYSNPQKIQYKYILENHDKNWIDAGNRNIASYTNLDPGEYTLKVLATNSDGVWIKEAKQLSIIIYPPFWETTFAYIFYGLIFIVGVFTIDRVQRRRILAKEKNAAQIREANLRAQLAESESERKTKELEDARKLQLSMLPKELPQLPHLDIAVYMKTATEVGGDYYDFHVHSDGTLTVILGDATGHGMMSGMMVSIMKSLFMSDRTNKELKPFFENTSSSIKDMQLGRLMMALSCVQISSNKVKTTNAGMPPLLIYRSNSQKVEEVNINNMPLGAMKKVDYDVKEFDVEKGDTLLMMSDGFTELKNETQELYGYRRARNSFEDTGKSNPEEIIKHLKEEGIKWTNDKDPDDDVSFVVIKIK